jgi:hypothetical protein
LKRICDVSAHLLYEVKKFYHQQDANWRELEDSKKILDKNTEIRVCLCVEVVQYFEEWLWTVRREKASSACGVVVARALLHALFPV